MASPLKLETIVRTRTAIPPIGTTRQISDAEAAALDERLDAAEIMCNEQLYNDAVELATQCLQTAESLFGGDDPRLVRPYVLLGRCTAHLGNLKKAEKILSLANFIVIKNERVSSEIKSMMFRAIGEVYSLKKTDNESLRMYADDIYHASLAFGPEDFHTAGGYCGLGCVFANMGVVDKASVSYGKMADIWFRTLLKMIDDTADESIHLNDVDKSQAQAHLLEGMQFFGGGAVPDRLQEGMCAGALAMMCSISPQQAELTPQFCERCLALWPKGYPLRSRIERLAGQQ